MSVVQRGTSGAIAHARMALFKTYANVPIAQNVFTAKMLSNPRSADFVKSYADMLQRDDVVKVVKRFNGSSEVLHELLEAVSHTVDCILDPATPRNILKTESDLKRLLKILDSKGVAGVADQIDKIIGTHARESAALLLFTAVYRGDEILVRRIGEIITALVPYPEAILALGMDPEKTVQGVSKFLSANPSKSLRT